MNLDQTNLTTRREFLKNTGRIAAVSALAGVALPHVHAADSETIKIALIGCGGRGTGAAANALEVKSGTTKLVAMADVFENKLDSSHENLGKKFTKNFDVPDDRKFIGFDGYKKAMDCLEKGDIAIFATPLAFRWVHFTYAIERGLNVFMEKPLTADGPTTRKMLALAQEAKKKDLKVGVGLMVRHCHGRQELYKRIRGGQIGQVIAMRAYRMHGPVGSAFTPPGLMAKNELLHQIKRFHSFLWASGGLFSDFNIHQIDECCWMKGAVSGNPDEWPVKAHAIGGRHYRGNNIDQNFDNYSVEYTFKDGTKLFMDSRVMVGCHDEFASFAHGAKGSAIITSASHSPGKVRLFRNQTFEGKPFWAFPQPEPNPYALEWEDLVDAIRHDKPYNEVERGAMASLVTSMGRMSAHTGQIVTLDQILNSDHEFAPGADKFTADSPAPLHADADGKYPIPQPGIVKNREYAA